MAPEMSTDAVGVPSAGGINSSTNVQEAGVDEADIVEHDGRFVYSAIGGVLRVVDVETRAETYRTTLPGGDHRMVLSTGTDVPTLVVVGSDWSSGAATTVVSRFSVVGGVLVALAEDRLEGSVVAVRAVRGAVHIVLQSGFAERLDFVYPQNDTEDVRAAALAANRAVIDAVTATQLLPRRYQVATDGTVGPVEQALSCDAVGTPQAFSGHSVTWVATVDLADPEARLDGTAGVVADAGIVYAAPASLYVATSRYPEILGDLAPARPAASTTDLHQFAIDGVEVTYRASGTVDGRVLSSYSLSEHDGILRVATTTDGNGFGADRMSGIRTFETVDGEMRQIGIVDGLGRGESIQGVRFAGALAFVVTFEMIDPLYTVDLTDPKRPVVLGELKIPGFSTWLVPVSADRLLAYGQSGTDDGRITGVQWSLFDISDLTQPRLLATAAAGSWSEASGDPLAIMYIPEAGLIGAPGAEPMPVPVETGAEPGTPVPPTSERIGFFGESSFAWFGAVDADTVRETARVVVDAPVRRVLVVDGDLVIVDHAGTLTILDGLPNRDRMPAATRV